GTAVGAFADKNVGVAKAVAVTGNTISGTDAGNYVLIQQSGLTADITKANLSVTGVNATNKTYDTTLTATLSGTAAVAALGSDTVSVSGTGAGAFADKNVGISKAVSVTGFSLNGLDSGNYNIVQPAGLTANISAASLTVSGLTANAKTYDTTTTASLGGTASVTVLGSDVVTLGGTAVGAFADKNVGTAKTVAVTGNTISGTDAGNYVLIQQSGLTADITKANLSVTGVSATNKTYDTTLTATLTGTAAVTALSGDTVNVAGTGAGAFADKNVGISKAVTVSGFSLSGLDSGNYNIVQPAGLTANITAANLTISGLTANAKTYDTTTVASLGGTASVTALGSDVVTLGGTAVGTFADKNVGTAKTVAVTGNTISGTDAGNYVLIQQSGLTADITKANLSVTGVSATNKVYDTTPTATLSGTAAVAALGSDVVTLTGSGVGAFADKNVGVSKAVTVSGFSLSGLDSGNYNVVQPAGLTANISAANLTVSGLTTSSKTYDTTMAASLGGTASVTALSGDSVTLGGTAVGAFADKNVGVAKAVAVTGNTISGTDAGNYVLIQQSGLTADITKANLSVAGLSASNKVYDATTIAPLSGTASVTALGSDVVSVGGTGTGAFADKNVGISKAVTVSGVTLSGTDAGNYILIQQTGLVADITRANLVINAVTDSKVYDGTTASVGLPAIDTLSPLMDGDSLTGLTQSYTNSDVMGTNGSTLSINTGYTLNDGNGGLNYTVVHNSIAGTITPSLTSAWKATTGGDWNIAANWMGNFIPQAGATVTIPLAATGQTITQTVGTTANIAVLNLDGATLTLNGNLTAADLNLNSGLLNGTGSLTVSNNTTQVNGQLAGTWQNLNLNGLGNFNLSQTVTASQNITLTMGGAITSTAAADTFVLNALTLNLTAGTGFGSAAAPLQVATTNLNVTTTQGGGEIINTPNAAVTLTNFSTKDASAVTYRQNGMALTLNGSMSSAGGAILLDPPTDIIMTPGSSISSGGGSIDLLATGNIQLATLNAGTIGAVNINTTGGAITSGLEAGVSNVTGASLTASAVNGARFTHSATTATATSVNGVVAVTNAVTGAVISNEPEVNTNTQQLKEIIVATVKSSDMQSLPVTAALVAPAPVESPTVPVEAPAVAPATDTTATNAPADTANSSTAPAETAAAGDVPAEAPTDKPAATEEEKEEEKKEAEETQAAPVKVAEKTEVAKPLPVCE
ncbi:MAG: YDG domain-containing protein, partial [Gallionellaceae bacterium]